MADFHQCDVVRSGVVRAITVAVPSQQFGYSNCLPKGKVTGAVAMRGPGSQNENISGAEAVITSLRSDAAVRAERGDRALRTAQPNGGGLWVEDGSAWYDMACVADPELLGEARACASLDEDGGVTLGSAAHDAGDGACVAMTRIAADRLGLPTDRVRLYFVDSHRPEAPPQGEFRTALTVGSAIDEACVALMFAIARRASEDLASPFFGMPIERLRAEAGRITLNHVEGRAESWSDLAARWDGDPVAVALIHPAILEQRFGG